LQEGLSKSATNLRTVDIPYEIQICHSRTQVRNVANRASVFSTLVLFERKRGGITCTCINSTLILKRINNCSCDIIEVLTTKLGSDLALFPFLRFTKKERTINSRQEIPGRTTVYAFSLGKAVFSSPSFTGRLFSPHPSPGAFPLRMNGADRERTLQFACI